MDDHPVTGAEPVLRQLRQGDAIDDAEYAEEGPIVTPEQPSHAGYTESPEATAARHTQPGEGQRMKETLLMCPEKQHEEFMAC